MSTSTDLKELFNRARPLVEQWLEIADRFAELRANARTKGLDWAQIKTLLKAHIQDEADDGNRVQKLIEKADLSCAYADMLGLAKIEKNISRNEETTVTVMVDAAKKDAWGGLDIPEYLRRT